MNVKTHGVGVVGIIVVIVVLAAVVVGGLYFFSDVYRTKIQSAADQFARWTPENIAKDPIGYLDFCETKTKEAMKDLDARKISVAMQKGQFEERISKAKANVEFGNKSLNEIRSGYIACEANNSWPLKFANDSYDKEKAKRQIMRLAGDIKNTQEVLDKYETGLKQLNVQSGKIVEARSSADAQLAKISTNRELLKVQKITDDLKNSLVAMKSAVSSVVDVGSSEGDVKGLDAIVTGSESKIDDKEFDKIMSGGK